MEAFYFFEMMRKYSSIQVGGVRREQKPCRSPVL